MNIPNVYLSRRTSQASAKDVWTVIERGLPLMADSPSLHDALTVAYQRFGRCYLPVWNGDIGQFESEMFSDPNY